MPPSPKFTREEITAAALEIVSKKGASALTAREIGNVLNSSARPIFTVFKNMEELQNEVRKAAMAKFETYADKTSGNIPKFKQIGMNTIMFAINEPNLYRLLFMHENLNAVSFDDIVAQLGTTAEEAVETIKNDYALNTAKAKILFENVWIYTFGIGTLCAMGICKFSKQELSRMLSTEFRAILTFVKSEEYCDGDE